VALVVISVCLASYNGLPYIEEQLASVVMQLGADDELVVSDDGSTDGTWESVSRLAACDPRVRATRRGGRPDVVANFAAVFAAARGDVVLPCDQDDVWLPGRVAHFREAFGRHPALLLLQTDAALVDRGGAVTAPSFFALRRSGPGFFRNFTRNSFQGCSLGFRRTLLDLALPFPRAIPMHDVWLGLLAGLACPRDGVSFDAVVLTRHRRHGENRTRLAPAPWHVVLRGRAGLAAALVFRIPRIVRARTRRNGGPR